MDIVTLRKNIKVIAAITVLFGQFALVLHDVVIPHELASSCEVCVFNDRFTDTVFGENSSFAFLSVGVLFCVFAFQVFPLRRFKIAQPRSPPVL
ncbi:MAG: hypothetical protein VYA80_02330 [Pseudomonadota bacterium]|nr:hypothetical protein [Pseudomonadota bacterium]